MGRNPRFHAVPKVFMNFPSKKPFLFFEKIAKPYSTLSPAEPSPMAWAILEKVLPS